MWLFGLFVALPLIEIALFVIVGGWLTLWPTLALVVLTTVLGSFVVRRQGRAAMAGLQRTMQELRQPAQPLADGAMILLAGVLLILPGFFTDSLGLLLLIPPVRSVIVRALAARVVVVRSQADWRRGGVGDAIETEYHEVKPDQKPLPGQSGWTQK
ncbi:MAG: FxsA family protein [Gemmobacter sp.]|nr:FxsA family protein [Gemmobacter sp.]